MRGKHSQTNESNGTDRTIRYGEDEHPLSRTDAEALLAARLRATPTERNTYGLHWGICPDGDDDNASMMASTILDRIDNQDYFTSFTAEAMLRMDATTAKYLFDDDNQAWLAERSEEVLEEYGYSNDTMFTTTELFDIVIDGIDGDKLEDTLYCGLNVKAPDSMEVVLAQCTPTPIVVSEDLENVLDGERIASFVVENYNDEPAMGVTTTSVQIPNEVDVYARVPSELMNKESSESEDFAAAIEALGTEDELQL